MKNTPEDPAEPRQADAGAAYLLEPFVTDDGVTVPPPTRPMGPRRLARYYDEVADYLRALEAGVEELPEKPLFMGSLATGPATASQRSLAALSAMGSIDNHSVSSEEELELGFDESRATVLEDPLAHVGQQVFGSQQEQDAAEAAEPVDFATSVGEIAGGGDFLSFEVLAPEGAETAETPEPASTHLAAEAEEEAASLAGKQSQELAFEAIDDMDAEELGEKEPPEEAPQGQASLGEAPDDEVPEGTDEQVSAELPQPAEEIEANALEEAPGLGLADQQALPTPVRAVDAQGLNLSEIDETLAIDLKPVTEPAGSAGFEPEAGTVDSESSDMVTAPSKAEAVSEPVEKDEAPAAADLANAAESATGREASAKAGSFVANSESAPSGQELTDTPEETTEGKGGAAASIIGIMVLIILLLVVWFFFFQ